MPRSGWWMAGVASLVTVVVVASLFSGEVAVSPGEAWRSLVGGVAGSEAGSTAEAVFRAIRLPRILGALLAGAVLGMAGAALQGLYRTRMADPFLLGVSSAAGFGAALAVVVSPVGVSSGVTALLAAAAGVAVALGTRAIARSAGDPGAFVLGGVALALTLLAWTVILIFVADSPRLPTFAYFVFGGLGGLTWSVVFWALPGALVGMALLLVSGRDLDVLALGETAATRVGVPVPRVAAVVLVGVGVGVGASVALAGVIGFVGLLAPAAMRPLVGPGHRALLPASAVGGAGMLVAADLIARSVAGPVEIPVGIVTAAVGGPLLVAVVVRRTVGLR